MSPLLVQLLLSVLVIVFAIGMMVFMYQFARRKMMQDSDQHSSQQPLTTELKTNKT